ncbi:hypothetical protein QQF64_008313 [Cirrhinus molitorella]|uniref:Uncharacterized protein n=1 Tax=Cirrhinus molitorella TaxID=172907 RepID=A0ABR3M8A0_9TELE
MTPTLEISFPNPNTYIHAMSTLCMRSLSRCKKRRRNYVLFPDTGNAVNSVARENGTVNPLPSILASPAVPKINQYVQ